MEALPQLLQDKTTGKNIIFATDDYNSLIEGINKKSEIKLEMFDAKNALDIQPRVYKSFDKQVSRTKQKAEVFTPTWICNQMNNYCDEVWFKKTCVFNAEEDQKWVTTTEKIQFAQNRSWVDYVLSNRLEITCGEAPFIVSRYDASTGCSINLWERVGILDRKIRVISENTTDESEWINWTIRAFQSVFGYEFQGDNLLIARLNLFLTFVEYLQMYWRRSPTKEEIESISEIISWNFWQMDGLTFSTPFSENSSVDTQLDLFLHFDQGNTPNNCMECMIFDWHQNKKIVFKNLDRQ